ncbi:ATP/GTP-binding protein [Saccharopolyspora sp. K220]|nr:ATP/GTP-binding protein [Saccharopolyspora soli]MCI2416634.1 ATP/GTP-binding protein [Saccharopolyspora soli]
MADTASGERIPRSVKFLVSGGLGAGKTSFVGSVSEITPLRTEERLSETGEAIDDLSHIEDKRTTTVALDFGRITLASDLVLYLFGTPGQSRFWYMWNDLAVGALGAVVLIDTRRFDVSFAAIDFFEHRGIPFIIAVNRFPDSEPYTAEEIRTALELDPEIPIMTDCSALEFESCREALMVLQEHVMRRVAAEAALVDAVGQRE